MSWRVAKSLLILREQVNAEWPNRRKENDGTIGDAAHASRSSDHNPWVKDGAIGVVTAEDITHDPASGCDSYKLAQALLDSRDDRIKYIISNHRIASGNEGPSPWAWRRYTGANPHDHHCHISVKSDKSHYDNERLWNFDGSSKPAPAAETDYPPHLPQPLATMPPTIRKGDHGDTVRLLQIRLGFTGKSVDGDFGIMTETALKGYQLTHHIVVDGICGPQTWKTFNLGG